MPPLTYYYQLVCCSAEILSWHIYALGVVPDFSHLSAVQSSVFYVAQGVFAASTDY